MFMWVIILCGFCIVVYFTSDFDRHANNEVSHNLDALAYQVQQALADGETGDVTTLQESLVPLFSAAFDHSSSRLFSPKGIVGIRLEVGEHVLDFGRVDEAVLNSDQRTVLFKPGENSAQAEKARVEAFFLSSAALGKITRQKMVIAVVVVILMFGVLLRLVIQNVLAKPFQVLMDAIRCVSNGDLSLRLDVSRQDEFGHLSRFFNQMLERVQSQQEELTEANRGLTSEIAVREQAEQKLRAHQDELEKVIDERTRDLAVARDQALAASQTKSAFIANISHEIRTPLTPIIGFAEAMLTAKQDVEEQKQSLRTIIRNGRHLSHIINEILDLSKIEANSLEIEKIDVNVFAILSDVESVVRVLVEEKGLDLMLDYEYPIPAVITSDPTRLKQILMNLATNAVKFTSKGHIRISTRYAAEERLLHITVFDSGVGVARDKIDRLFQPFSQADCSTTRQFGGTGLGLYISKRLAKILGGDISLDSVEGIGSRFTLSVHVGEREDLEMADTLPHDIQDDLCDLEPSESPSLSGKVLLAEDSRDIQRLMTFLLKRFGAEVTCVENGKLAVEAALGNEYDLILMDMQMPVMGGIEAVELLHASGCSTPIVALTANAMKEDRQLYDEVGCNGFLPKPVEQGKLYKVLQQYLGVSAVTQDMTDANITPDEPGEFDGLIEEFRAGLPDYILQIKTSLTSGDLDTLRELAHQLKGMGTSFGYPEITATAMDVNTAVKNGRKGEARNLSQRLLRALEHALLPAAEVET